MEESATKFFDETYAEASSDVYAGIREATFGEDIGQFSWTTADEYRRFVNTLGISDASSVLEVACGSGGPALYVASTTGCRLVGLDVHEGGVAAASAAVSEAGLAERVRFMVHDAVRPLTFDDGSFDAIISIDAMNHLLDRAAVFAEWHRVLRPGGRFLFTDAVIVRGPLRREEIINRSPGMGEFIFTPEGTHERLLGLAGFAEVSVEDVTANIIGVASRWHAARVSVAAELDAIEGTEANAEFQRFLATVALVARENRLLRCAYSAVKP